MKKIIALLFLFNMMGSFCIYAADAEYRFTHNDHDTLIIGKITEFDDETVVIKPVDYIVSTKDLNVNAKKKQLRPELVKLTSDSVKQLNERGQLGRLSKLGVGDNVVASFDKKGNEFSIAWGVFKVDSTDYKTLSVEAYSEMTAAMLKDFINSGGKYTEFSGNGSTNTLYRITTDGNNNQTRVLIYQGETENTDAVDTSVVNESAITLQTNYNQYLVYGIAGAIILAFMFIVFKKYRRCEKY